jgi:hypothetical protein
MFHRSRPVRVKFFFTQGLDLPELDVVKSTRLHVWLARTNSPEMVVGVPF